MDYAFLDIKLRGMTGIELAKLIKESFPETKILFCTAYSEYAFESIPGICPWISAEAGKGGRYS